MPACCTGATAARSRAPSACSTAWLRCASPHPCFFTRCAGTFACRLQRMRILGIDPGLQTTGFGVVDADGPRLAYVASGTIRTGEASRGDLPARLKIIFDGVREVVERYAPACACAEIVFVNVNPQSTLLLG